ncbi:hypothetical protein [Streptomyces sp. NBC_00582]|uniref:hypothetical protein n=1 Tax=Streptomyces sp. NBC_00582 TaxID=2975783 RepID=UPI0010625D3F|nr:hypothetical protein [Streptomyces sp. NBC_00582]WUB61819.1 hypothetical protein OG852_16180 [Streptomyces sp. NBC_00582]
MYEYEIQQARAAELLRRAAHERLAREAVRSRRAARREAAERAAGRNGGTGEGESHSAPPRGPRLARPA